MTSESQSTSSRSFFRIVEELVLMTKDQALIVEEAVKKSGSSPEQVALQKGYLNAAQIDIVETLMHPTETVPGYEILDVLGQGGMGVVYEARQLNLNRIVALKTILLSRMSDKSAAGRFEQEARTVGKLRHPNIIQAYDFGRHEGRLFLAMELVDGEDVDALLKDEGRLDEQTAWGIARQAAAGLAHACRLGVVHRDVKPANLLLVEPPDGFPLPPNLPMVKIADFGLAFLSDDQQAHTRLTSDNAAVGSPHYMAPEQLTELDVDHRADIYALGATVYHMLAGRPPFSGLNLTQIITQKLSGEMKRLNERCPEVSQASGELVTRMLSRDPDDRPQHYDSLLKEIDRVIATLAPMPPVLPQRSTDMGDKTSTEIVARADTMSMPAGKSQAVSPSASAATPAKSGRYGWQLVAGGTVLVALLGLGGWMFRPIDTPAVLPQRIEMGGTGWQTPLFVGTSRDGWRTRHGNWITTRDDEGGSVLAGSDGIIERAFLRRGDHDAPEAMEHYRITLSVDPHEATAVEVHFGVLQVQVPERDTLRYVARLTTEGVTLGTRPTDRGPFAALSSPVPLPKDFAARHSVQVERQPGGWFVTVDGTNLPGLPLLADTELAGVQQQLQSAGLDFDLENVVPTYLPEFRLAVEDGPAWFADLFIEELRPTGASD